MTKAGTVAGWLARLDQPFPLRTLAFLRMAAALLSLLLFVEGFLCHDWLGRQGPRHSPGLLVEPSLDLFFAASQSTVLGLLTLGVASSVGLLLGLFTPLNNLLSWLLLLSLRNHLSWLMSEGAIQVTQCVLLALFFTPCARVYALDARLGWRALWPNSAWPIRAIQWLQIVIYLESGCYKLMGLLWYNGSALKLALQNYNFSRVATWIPDPWPSPWLQASALAGWLVLLWELTFPFWLLHRITRRLCIAIGLSMHAVLWVAFDIGYYAPAMMMLYLTYLPGPSPEPEPASGRKRFLLGVSLWQMLATCWAALPWALVYPEPKEASPVPGLQRLEATLSGWRSRLLPVLTPLHRYCQYFGVYHRYNTFSPNPPRLAVFYRLLDPAGSVVWTDFPGQGRRYSWEVGTLRGAATLAPHLLPVLLDSFSRRYHCPRFTLEEWAVDLGRPLGELALNRSWNWARKEISAIPDKAVNL